MKSSFVAAVVWTCCLGGGAAAAPAAPPYMTACPSPHPFCNHSLPARARARDLVSRLTLPEKIAQLSTNSFTTTVRTYYYHHPPPSATIHHHGGPSLRTIASDHRFGPSLRTIASRDTILQLS